MWVFTKYGFYSAVCARQGDGQKTQPVDTERAMVRARLKPHLENLKRRFPDALQECEIREDSNSDYRYRIFVPKSVWAEVLQDLADEMDYDNFKSEAARHSLTVGSSYHDALAEVWQTMRRLQK